MSNIPIIVICYNNYKYVENTLKQIKKINVEYYKNIQIVNNSSSCLETINFLNNVDVKVINNDNNGPWICASVNKHIYDTLPDKYIVTDPDLEFNVNLPTNFIEIMSEVSDKYQICKIGFALDISDFEKMYKSIYHCGSTIYEWEQNFWSNKINDDLELYYAPIDTTFCLVNKLNEHNGSCIRMAGNFTAKHLPWYIDNKLYNIYENYILNCKTTCISTISGIVNPYIESNYLKVYKNDELFFIENDINNDKLYFWRCIYSNWKVDTFKILDKYLSKDKIFIDIGGWIGTSTLYGSRKSKHVYSIEADNKSFNDLKINLEKNCTNNFTLINKAFYNVDNIEIKFGKNKFLYGSKMNDSTSHIYRENDTSDEFYLIQTITLESLIKSYQIDYSEIGLIKVDIEGGEEYILEDLFNIHNKYNIPLYIRFHYSWWNYKNLDRFDFLTDDTKDKIISYPFISLLF
jgi:hypothetical protein